MIILANKNFSFIIYCENIVVAFLNFDFLFLYFIFPFSLYFFSSIRLFFLFFSFFFCLDFSPLHTYTRSFLYVHFCHLFFCFSTSFQNAQLFLFLLSLSSLLYLFFYGGSVWIEISFAETENTIVK